MKSRVIGRQYELRKLSGAILLYGAEDYVGNEPQIHAGF